MNDNMFEGMEMNESNIFDIIGVDKNNFVLNLVENDVPDVKNICEKTKVEKKSSLMCYKRCETCFQCEDTSDKVSHPKNAIKEIPASQAYDVQDNFHITYFSVYDKVGHLCPFDTGLIEQDVELYLSGYLKAIDESDESINGGIPKKDIGPITEWWSIGFEINEKLIVGISTDYGNYYLMKPSPDYASIMLGINGKLHLTKVVIELLMSKNDPSIEDLLLKLMTFAPSPEVPVITEETLIKNAWFVCEQVHSFEEDFYKKEHPLTTKQFMQFLIKFSSVSITERKYLLILKKKEVNSLKPRWTNVTTTPLVNSSFDGLFTNKLDETVTRDSWTEKTNDRTISDTIGLKERELSQKNGLSQRKSRKKISTYTVGKNRVQLRRSVRNQGKNSKTGMKKMCKMTIKWSGNILANECNRKFYQAAIVNNEKISIGDYVSVKAASPTDLPAIGRIFYMWENKMRKKFMHIQWFVRGNETALEEAANPHELFMVNQCENSLLGGILSKVKVVRIYPQKDWGNQGGRIPSAIDENLAPKSENIFFLQKLYVEKYGRFEDVQEDNFLDPIKSHRYCPSCKYLSRSKEFDSPSAKGIIESYDSTNEVHYEIVTWRGGEYSIGSFIYFNPDTSNNNESFQSFSKHSKNDSEMIDDILYPEQYRKAFNNRSIKVPKNPFSIGQITDIVKTEEGNISLHVNKFYRSEDITGINSSIISFNQLFSSEEDVLIDFSDVAGKCYVAYSKTLNEDINTWLKKGPHRFYFSESYDVQKQKLVEHLSVFETLGISTKGNWCPNWPSIKRPLRCMDIFSGCGGLSEGLHQSGLSETKWAIEKDELAAQAFHINNPMATVFPEDSNILLKYILNGALETDNGQKLPRKGEVELICGGPPCQGFSIMNRFNSTDYSTFKNSLVISFLAYCDYYRPKFCILENVKNFFTFKNGIMLKLTLSCLIKMGYQVTFGILQAGNYGVPQSRKRAFIFAAAPGEVLPNFPEPTNVFHSKNTKLSINLGDKLYKTNCKWVDSAPHRALTVRDAISDLPSISSGFMQEEMPFMGEANSHFQKTMREKNSYVLRDHICRKLSPIVERRMSHIPTTNGSDWRNLPNIRVMLDNGDFTNKLIYSHDDQKNGQSSNGNLRGVCACASGEACDPNDRQRDTLIPWSLVHTANKNNNWAGLFGRLNWNGVFKTTVTNPDPMGKQGQVLHPEQNRVISVRECARSQGFPDHFKFYGLITDKYRQIGNAVPPPLGASIGQEVIKCLIQKEKLQTNCF